MSSFSLSKTVRHKLIFQEKAQVSTATEGYYFDSTYFTYRVAY